MVTTFCCHQRIMIGVNFIYKYYFSLCINNNHITFMKLSNIIYYTIRFPLTFECYSFCNGRQIAECRQTVCVFANQYILGTTQNILLAKGNTPHIVWNTLNLFHIILNLTKTKIFCLSLDHASVTAQTNNV